MASNDDPDKIDVPEITEFDAALEAVNEAHARALPAARSVALQRSAADAYDALIHEASRLKAKVVERGDEDSAARLLCAECAAGALMSTLRLWIAFKEEDMGRAWNYMVDAQEAWTGALRAHPIGQQFRQLAVVPFQVQSVLFPHVAFISTGMIVRQSECTICGQTPGECDHVRGRVYAGRFAGVLVAEADPREVSIVDIPADKRCRVEQLTTEGVTRDALTWEIMNTERSASSPRDNVIQEGRHALKALRKGAYSSDQLLANLLKCLESVNAGALAISSQRKERHRPDEWAKLAHSVLPIQSALEKHKDKGVMPGKDLIEAFSGPLEDAEKSQE